MQNIFHSPNRDAHTGHKHTSNPHQRRPLLLLLLVLEDVEVVEDDPLLYLEGRSKVPTPAWTSVSVRPYAKLPPFGGGLVVLVGGTNSGARPRCRRAGSRADVIPDPPEIPDLRES